MSDISLYEWKTSLNDFHNCMSIQPLIKTTPQVPNMHFVAKTFTKDIQAEAVDCNLIPDSGNNTEVFRIAH